jgi:hypothetical protein
VASSNKTGKRPFWMHQLVEYLLGGVLVAQGLQSPDPVAPAVAGLLVLANASTVRGGALSAFRLASRSMHRLLDLVVIAVVVALAVQPRLRPDAGARMIMIAIAAVLGFVWWQSSFAERPRRARGGAAAAAAGGSGSGGQSPSGSSNERSTEIGRMAGRLVGDGINAAKRRKKS